MTFIPTPEPPKRGGKVIIDGHVWTCMHTGDVDGEERVLVGRRCVRGHLHVQSYIVVRR